MMTLRVEHLTTHFHTPGGVARAVEDVSFDIERGKVFGLVGESGSGKTLTALSILALVPPPGKIVGGRVLFNGKDLVGMDREPLRRIRGSRISMVFQEPASALDPVFTIGEQIVEAIRAHEGAREAGAKERALEYLRRVHIHDPEKVFYDYPHELSGGMKQRAMIAMALVNSPELVILDEPTTALDVTVQAQILGLLDEVIENEALSILFISHDIGVIARMCDRVAVMYKGSIVESNDADELLCSPKHPYTISLLESAKALS